MRCKPRSLPIRTSACLLLGCLASAIWQPNQLAGQPRVWRRALPGTFRAVAFNPLSKGRVIFACPYDTAGIARSDDAGATWEFYTTGLDPQTTAEFHQVFCFPSDTNILIGVSPSQLYRSTTGGRSWDAIGADSLWGIDGEDLAYQDLHDALYYGKNYAGPTFKTTDRGLTWLKTGPPDMLVGLCTIAVSADDPPILLAGSEDGIIARSTNEGTIWSKSFDRDTGGGTSPEVPKIVFATHSLGTDGAHSVAIATRWLSGGPSPSGGILPVRSIVLTQDAGKTWKVLPFSSRNAWALDIDQRTSRAGSSVDPRPLRFWTGLFHDRSDTVTNGLIQETTDGGRTWHSTNFPRGDSLSLTNPWVRDVWVIKYDSTSDRLVAATGSGLYIGETVSDVVPSERLPDVTVQVSGGLLEIQSPTMMQTIEMIDILGRVTSRWIVNGDQLRSNLPKVSSGVYLLRIEFGSGEYRYERAEF